MDQLRIRNEQKQQNTRGGRGRGRGRGRGSANKAKDAGPQYTEEEWDAWIAWQDWAAGAEMDEDEPSVRKPKAKPKAKAKAKGKPKAKAKASLKTAKGKRASSEMEVAEGEDEGQDDGKEASRDKSKGPATFARRYCPERAYQASQWQALKDAFSKHIREKVDAPSSHEAGIRLYLHCLLSVAIPRDPIIHTYPL